MGNLVEAAGHHNVDLLPANLERAAHSYRGRFDTIVAFDVFEHLTYAQIVDKLRACETMMKPGGHILLRFPNAQSPFGLAPQNGDPTHRSALSRGVFEQLAQGMPFEIIRYQSAFRPSGTGIMKFAVRLVRYACMDLIAFILNSIYAQRIPWDPVVVLVLRRL